MAGPYEFRVVEASHPDPLKYLSCFWEKRLGEYVKIPDHERDLQAPESNNSKFVWAGVALSAIIVSFLLYNNIVKKSIH